MRVWNEAKHQTIHALAKGQSRVAGTKPGLRTSKNIKFSPFGHPTTKLLKRNFPVIRLFPIMIAIRLSHPLYVLTKPHDSG